MVAVINADVYPILVFSSLIGYLEDTGIGVFWVRCVA